MKYVPLVAINVRSKEWNSSLFYHFLWENSLQVPWIWHIQCFSGMQYLCKTRVYCAVNVHCYIQFLGIMNCIETFLMVCFLERMLWRYISYGLLQNFKAHPYKCFTNTFLYSCYFHWNFYYQLSFSSSTIHLPPIHLLAVESRCLRLNCPKLEH
jgi:hypothetical protein